MVVDTFGRVVVMVVFNMVVVEVVDMFGRVEVMLAVGIVKLVVVIACEVVASN